MFFAALTSVFALIEVPTAAITSRFAISRKKAIAITCAVAAFLSVLVNLGYSVWKEVTILGNSILDSLDIFISDLLMPIAAIICCIFVGWVIDTKEITDEIETEGQKFRWKKFFVIMVKYIAPICIIIIMVSNTIGRFF